MMRYNSQPEFRGIVTYLRNYDVLYTDEKISRFISSVKYIDKQPALHIFVTHHWEVRK